MHYYIDGYNLLFRLFGTDADFTAMRQKMIDELNSKAKLLNLEITIIFDSQYHVGEGTRSYVKSLEILFTNHGETADELILHEIKSQRQLQKTTVVTSDKKLAWFARRCSAKTESIEHFIAWLNKRYKNKLSQTQEVKPQRIVKKVVKRIIKKPLITIKDTPEACFEYYLEHFQKEVEKQPKLTRPVRGHSLKKNKLKKKIPPEEEEIPLSEQERWRHLFERRLHEDSE